MSFRFAFHHETLDAYVLARDVAQAVVRRRFPRGRTNLRTQAVRAAESMVLNIAEGSGRSGDARRNHYRIARGSAAELCAALDLIAEANTAEAQAKLRRVAAMLTKMGA